MWPAPLLVWMTWGRHTTLFQKDLRLECASIPSLLDPAGVYPVSCALSLGVWIPQALRLVFTLWELVEGTQGTQTFCLIRLFVLKPNNLLLPPGKVQAQEMAKT